MIIENKNLSPYIFHNFDNSLSSHVFTKPLKYADVTPIFKEDDEPFRKNYRRISIIPVLSKVTERLMYITSFTPTSKTFYQKCSVV